MLPANGASAGRETGAGGRGASGSGAGIVLTELPEGSVDVRIAVEVAVLERLKKDWACDCGPNVVVSRAVRMKGPEKRKRYITNMFRIRSLYRRIH
jgi:hypothetical protein